MMSIENRLVEALTEVLQEKYDLKAEEGFVMVEIPKDSSKGNYATNLAMRLTKILRRNPREIGEEIREAMLGKMSEIENIEVAGPGFINFTIRKDVLADVINKIIEQGDDYGKNETGKGTNILVEYVSANPTGRLHLGHARGAAWGDSLCRLLKASGYNCLREYYINDAGNQIDNLAISLKERYRELFGETPNLPDDGYHGPDVIEIAKDIKNEYGDKWMHVSDKEAFDFFREEGKNRELARIKEDLDYYRCGFDSWISETNIRKSGIIEQSLEKMEQMGLVYEADDALWLKTTEYGDDKDRVLRKSDGSYTYFTPDIANHLDKVNRGYEKLVNLWGADHHGYIPRMQAALKALGLPEGTLEVDIIQMVRLVENGEEVKMSKRTGNAVTIRELCDDIGVDSARYFFLAKALDTHLDFDLGIARKRTNENPVFYAQYAYARSCKVLINAGELNSVDLYDQLVEPQEVELLKHISIFPATVGEAAETRSPNKICNYVQKLAQYIHSFYASCRILSAETQQLKDQRLALLKASAITMKNALNLLGVEAPEEM
ncbi:MAG: arginine--tRNA ligase [Erysipelotrichaceae bacterium]|nr:arginine--tRNA ligase [Erysipelotrichaceae bacterium]